jgi:hypothetical protein
MAAESDGGSHIISAERPAAAGWTESGRRGCARPESGQTRKRKQTRERNAVVCDPLHQQARREARQARIARATTCKVAGLRRARVRCVSKLGRAQRAGGGADWAGASPANRATAARRERGETNRNSYVSGSVEMSVVRRAERRSREAGKLKAAQKAPALVPAHGCAGTTLRRFARPQWSCLLAHAATERRRQHFCCEAAIVACDFISILMRAERPLVV